MMARTFLPRNGSTKSHCPFASIVMKTATAATASNARMISRTAGVRTGAVRPVTRTAGRLANTGRPPQEQTKEDDAANHANHGADRNFVGVAHNPADNVADQDEPSSEQGHPGNGA